MIFVTKTGRPLPVIWRCKLPQVSLNFWFHMTSINRLIIWLINVSFQYRVWPLITHGWWCLMSKRRNSFYSSKPIYWEGVWGIANDVITSQKNFGRHMWIRKLNIGCLLNMLNEEPKWSATHVCRMRRMGFCEALCHMSVTLEQMIDCAQDISSSVLQSILSLCWAPCVPRARRYALFLFYF